MKITSYEVTISIDVWDEEALLKAGRARAIEDGYSESDAENLDVGDCLISLLDPGVSPPGTDIQNSSAESWGVRGDDEDTEEDEDNGDDP